MVDVSRKQLDLSLAALDHRLVGAGGPFQLGRGPNGQLRYVTGPQALTDLYSRARRMGPKPLLARGAERWSYGEIFEQALARAASLRFEDWAGRRIALALDDGAEWLIWFVAITAAGASCVMPPPNSSAELTKACWELAECDALVALPSHPLSPIASRNLYSLELRASETPSTAEVNPEAEAVVTFTSGSSGAPKGVVHSHRSLVTGLRNMMLGGALASHMLPACSGAPERPQTPSSLLLSPFAYIGGYSAFLLSIATGGRIVLPEADDVASILGAIEAEGIQAIAGASPDMVRRLMRHPGALQSMRSLRRLQLHGMALQKSLVDELAAALPGVQLLTGYGSSETGGSIAVAAVTQVIDQIGGCGRLLPSVELRAVDAENSVLPEGSLGALQVRGDMLMVGYLGKSRGAAVTSDGWYSTGDMGFLLEGRWLSVVGRQEEEILGAVGFVAPIEDAIRAVCGIDDVAVASSPDGKELVLYLEVQSQGVVDVAAAREALKSASGWPGPVRIHSLEAFPRTASGKVDRRRMAT